LIAHQLIEFSASGNEFDQRISRYGRGHLLCIDRADEPAYTARATLRKPRMPKITPASFTPDLVIMMRRALDTTAADQVPKSSRTPATKAKMAQRIVRSAAEGVTDAQELVAVAIDEGREPAL
jgi:hypothetical protein